MHSASGKWRDRRLQTKQAGEPSGYGRVISTVIDQAVERRRVACSRPAAAAADAADAGFETTVISLRHPSSRRAPTVPRTSREMRHVLMLLSVRPSVCLSVPFVDLPELKLTGWATVFVLAWSQVSK